jgi:hypothetical protein
MKDMENFDIAKYLREHQLGSYGILNHYVDLKPLKEVVDVNSFNKFMTINYGHISHNLSDKEIAAFLNREDIKGLPIEQQADKFADYLVSQGLADTMAEDVTPEEVAEIPYEGPDAKLTGNGEGDTYAEPETVSEEEIEDKKYPLADFANAVEAASRAGVTKDTMLRLVNMLAESQIVSEESISEAPNQIDWENLDHTDISGMAMEIDIDELISRVEQTIQLELTNDETVSQWNPENPRQTAAQIRKMIKQLWIEKIRNWKG